MFLQALKLQKQRLKRLLPRRKKGQTLVEYALILAFISIVAIVVLQALGTKVKQVFTTVNDKLDQANSSGS